MTITCRPCNNGLGSVLENALQDWFDDAVGQVRFRAEGFPGRRRAPRLLHRQSQDGKFVLVIDATAADPSVQDMVRSDQFTVEFSTSDERAWRLAALKHAYLAACVLLKRVPDGEAAAAIRSELVTARDVTARDQLPDSPIASSLAVYKSQAPRADHSVALVALHSRDSGELVDVGVSLAGTVFVSWPLEPQFLIPVIQRHPTGPVPVEANPMR